MQSVPIRNDGVVSLVQPTKDDGTSKKSKPSPFYLSLIIGDKIVHNFMIDSGASSSIMPRCVTDQDDARASQSSWLSCMFGRFDKVVDLFSCLSSLVELCGPNLVLGNCL